MYLSFRSSLRQLARQKQRFHENWRFAKRLQTSKNTSGSSASSPEASALPQTGLPLLIPPRPTLTRWLLSFGAAFGCLYAYQYSMAVENLKMAMSFDDSNCESSQLIGVMEMLYEISLLIPRDLISAKTCKSEQSAETSLQTDQSTSDDQNTDKNDRVLDMVIRAVSSNDLLLSITALRVLLCCARFEGLRNRIFENQEEVLLALICDVKYDPVFEMNEEKMQVVRRYGQTNRLIEMKKVMTIQLLELLKQNFEMNEIMKMLEYEGPEIDLQAQLVPKVGQKLLRVVNPDIFMEGQRPKQAQAIGVRVLESLLFGASVAGMRWSFRKVRYNITIPLLRIMKLATLSSFVGVSLSLANLFIDEMFFDDLIRSVQGSTSLGLAWAMDITKLSLISYVGVALVPYSFIPFVAVLGGMIPEKQRLDFVEFKLDDVAKLGRILQAQQDTEQSSGNKQNSV